MRRTAREAKPLDGRVTADTGLPCPTVDAKLVLIAALQPRAADIVTDRRAAPLDGAFKDDKDRLSQTLDCHRDRERSTCRGVSLPRHAGLQGERPRMFSRAVATSACRGAATGASGPSATAGDRGPRFRLQATQALRESSLRGLYR